MAMVIWALRHARPGRPFIQERAILDLLARCEPPLRIGTQPLRSRLADFANDNLITFDIESGDTDTRWVVTEVLPAIRRLFDPDHGGWSDSRLPGT